MFAFVGAHLKRQVPSSSSPEWINGGDFLGLGDAKDPVAGCGRRRPASFTIPRRPIPRRMRATWRTFVVTRGGEYGFMPSLSALRWLAELQDPAP